MRAVSARRIDKTIRIFFRHSQGLTGGNAASRDLAEETERG
jgi:hypothetical protein